MIHEGDSFTRRMASQTVGGAPVGAPVDILNVWREAEKNKEVINTNMVPYRQWTLGWLGLTTPPTFKVRQTEALPVSASAALEWSHGMWSR